MIDVDELRTLFLFESLSEPQLAWIAERADERTFDAGATVFTEGDPAAYLWVLLAGELRLLRRVAGEDMEINRTGHRGGYSGSVRAYVDEPDQAYPNSLLAGREPARFLRLPAADFRTFMREEFPMAVHLLDGLYLGMRNSEGQVRQREHLAQFGTLSANLAHELNNPAAATVRASGQLRERVAGMRHKLGVVASGHFDPTSMARLVELQETTVARAAKTRDPLSPVEQSDLEDTLVDALEAHGLDAAYELAAVFAGAGLDAAWVDDVVEQVGAEPLEGALRWMGYTLEAEALMDEIQDASTRISVLVGAVKEYSHMDAATFSDLDVHPGLDSTVVMLGHKLGGIEVRREYDRALPQVPGYAAELNQVWTNLIDNAADAMDGRGTLVLRTHLDSDALVVEVSDTGPGIPPALQEQVFAAFFTTKAAGKGSGLGLDNARRIVVQRHRGALELDSTGDGTTFRVRLPLTAS